ncbi:MAG: amino acid dehydrogenase [Legionellaceae bacterium]|nr:amino acid dehydrogenase [Legionellaceae bacterium]
MHTDTLPSNYDFLEDALKHDFGDVHCLTDRNTGMRAIIAIHNTQLGPSLGGCRFIPYVNSNEALYDALRLARGMSYKAASVDLPLGGGKAVIMQPQTPYDREGYFHAFGKFVQSLNGRYITALDSGTTLQDMDIIGQHTSYVASLSSTQGDPSPSTAMGVFRGIQALVKHKLHKSSLKGLHVAIQGLGHVGFLLAQHLHEAGAKLTVADINPQLTQRAAQSFNAEIVPTNTIHRVACDVFSPCALGGIFNDDSIPELQAPILAGAANNQLAHRRHGYALLERGITYAVDYIINAGGLIFAASKYLQYSNQELDARVYALYDKVLKITELAEEDHLPPHVIADQQAEIKLGLRAS